MFRLVQMYINFMLEHLRKSLQDFEKFSVFVQTSRPCKFYVPVTRSLKVYGWKCSDRLEFVKISRLKVLCDKLLGPKWSLCAKILLSCRISVNFKIFKILCYQLSPMKFVFESMFYYNNISAVKNMSHFSFWLWIFCWW